MDEKKFEVLRSHLRAVAMRMLGSAAEAEDAVQETWLRIERAETQGVENLRGWLTTVVARVCLDMLRARKSRREEAETESIDVEPDAETQLAFADSLGPALLVVLDSLEPAERLAFVLHDVFGMPFEEIAPIAGRSPTAARKLASRARQRLHPPTESDDAPDDPRRAEIVEAFLIAAKAGDLSALLTVLDPSITLRADAYAVKLGSAKITHGADAVARTFIGRALGAQRAIVDGYASVVWAPGGKPRVVFDFTIAGDRIVAIDLIAVPEHVASMTVNVLE